MHNINQFTPDDSALVLIDHQPFIAFPIESHSRGQIVNNVTALAKAAKALDVPTVLTTINGKDGPLVDPLFAPLREVFPDAEPIDRTNTNAWSDPRFVAAIEKTGRRKLVMAGLWTEVCLAQTTISALKAGYEVFIVGDASGGLSREAHEDAKTRMVRAGAVPMSWMSTVAEWCPDNGSPEYARLYSLVMQHGGGLGVSVEYVFAQIASGRVPAPERR
jgi:nicotinamidase-related amidase